MMMRRQFLNLVATKFISGGRPAYTLHRIDPSTFFFDSPGSAARGTGDELEKFELPPATMTFYGPCSKPHLDFIPFGSNRSILALDGMGRTALYDTAASPPAISTMPSMHDPKGSPISLPVGDKLYVMDSNPGDRHCFEALIHGRGSKGRCYNDWYWHSLPMPPFVQPSNYVPYDSDMDDDDYCSEEEFLDGTKTFVDGHAVVGDSQIVISTTAVGTYSFDTANGSWREEEMGWSLPFTGRAEYVPELNLWFGFSSKDNRLCAVDLSASASATAAAPPPPPVVRGVWDDVPQQQEWRRVKSYILPLGSGKLLVAKYFVSDEMVRTEFGDCLLGRSESFAVFAGVELVEEAGAGGGLRMLKHRSRRYDRHTRWPDWLI